MAIQRIRQLGDPLLRKRSREVEGADATLCDLQDTLHEFQRSHGFGRGISAVQIGVLKRVIYIEFEGRAFSLINPEIVHASKERFQLWDDCFSFPSLLVRLERATGVRIRYCDETGTICQLDAMGALSELLQHEMDHLEGILAVDRALDMMTREEYERVNG